MLAAVLLFAASGVNGAAAKGAKDPCDVAIGRNATCTGADCAFDPDVELEGPWQRVGACIKGLRGTWEKSGPRGMVTAGGKQAPVADVVRNTVYRAMTQGHAAAALVSDPGHYVPLEQVINTDLSFKAPVVRIAQLNDRDVPYTAMSQTGLARVLYAFARMAGQGGYPQAAADRAGYLAIANASIQTVLTSVDDGGLASTSACSAAPELSCSWFHAVTRKNGDADDGGTLNKGLHAIRDLIIVRDAAEKNGWPVDPAWDKAVEAGLNQLFLSSGHTAAGLPPNFADFMASPGDGPSWAYYGFNPSAEPPKGGYFLKQSGTNCGYHDHVLDLMATILKRTEGSSLAPQARTRALVCDSPLRQMYLARIENIPAPASAAAATDPARWCARPPGKEFAKRTRYLERAYAACTH